MGKLKINGQHGSSQKKESITEEVKVSEHPAETASAASQKNNGHTGPDLSTITSKFRSARPNPFENLLKLSCVGKKTQEGVKKTEDDLGETAEVADDHKSDFL